MACLHAPVTVILDRTCSGAGIVLQAGTENLFKIPFLTVHPLESFCFCLGSGVQFCKDPVSHEWADHF